ncbi:MAG: DUF1501 domain-containing protein [Armatimonadetes bacterium]|nr:DUF1501 domain-containing protein [Armatimonadota bacterium]
MSDCPECTPRNLSRRTFLKNGALAMVGAALSPGFLARAVEAAPDARGRVLVVIFQRGAVDGLSMVVPHAAPEYYKLRKGIAIPREQVLDLDGYFGLHPSLAPFKPLFDRRTLAIVQASGSPDNTRSHFDAQDYMEAAAPGNKSVHDGWLNRYMGTAPNKNAFRAVSITANLPRSLSGMQPALAIPSVRSFGVRGGKSAERGFEAMYSQSASDVLHGTGKESFKAVETLRKRLSGPYQPANGANYPRGNFGQQMQQVAQLIKADLGLEIAAAEVGGWDTHANQRGPLAQRLEEFAQSVAALHQDLGDRMQDVLIITMSEFGRKLEENGSGGTDHGHGNCNFVIGGRVRGGRIYGQWPGLAPGQLFEGRDLAVTTDFRDVFGEAVVRFLQCRSASNVFPGYALLPNRFRGYLA